MLTLQQNRLPNDSSYAMLMLSTQRALCCACMPVAGPFPPSGDPLTIDHALATSVCYTLNMHLNHLEGARCTICTLTVVGACQLCRSHEFHLKRA